jgi:hypothetical protein
VRVVDDGDAGFSAGSGWTYQPNPAGYPYYQSDHHYRLGAANGTAATWTAGNLAAGTYRVSAAWVGFSNRATNAQYTIVDGSNATLATRTINQQLDPNDFTADGGTWEDLGTVIVSANGSLTVRLAGTGNQYLIADAVRFELVSAAPAAAHESGALVDNSAPPPPEGASLAVGDVGSLAPEQPRLHRSTPEAASVPVQRRLDVRAPQVDVVGHRVAVQTLSELVTASGDAVPAGDFDLWLKLAGE